MSRRLSWSVAIGATFLIALTGCANQGVTPGTALPSAVSSATASAAPDDTETNDPSDGSTASAAPGGTGSSTTQSDSTVTVTDINDNAVDLRTSSIRVLGDETLTLGSGQAVPLKTVNRIDVTHASTGAMVDISLTNGQTVSGPYDSYVQITGDADPGPYVLVMLNVKTVEFRRDVPFVATPLPQLPPWTSAAATITDNDGKASIVSGPSLRVLGNEDITLDTGQQVALQRIKRIDATHSSTGTVLSITLVTGKKVEGSFGDYSEISADATTGGVVKLLIKDLTSLEIQRGGAS